MWKWTSARRSVREALPGNNCGGCGYPGCDGAAAAVVKGEAPISVCPVGGSPVAAAIGAIMGQEAGAQERRKAVVRCAGTCDVAKNKYEYTGARTAPTPFLYRAAVRRAAETDVLVLETA